jgi:hypothetical protein
MIQQREYVPFFLNGEERKINDETESCMLLLEKM